MRRSTAALICAASLTLSGCAAKTADYSTIWTSGASATTTAPPTSPTPIAQYLSGVGVTGQQVPLDLLTDLTVTLPRPPGWTPSSPASRPSG